MRLTSMDISFKYTCGLVNVEQTFHIDFEPNEKVDMIPWIIDKATLLEQAGMQPAVVKEHKNLGSPTARAHGATGRTYDDLEPLLDGNGKQRLCPECGQSLFSKRIKFKSGRRAGQWGAMAVHAKKGSCNFVEFGE